MKSINGNLQWLTKNSTALWESLGLRWKTITITCVLCTGHCTGVKWHNIPTSHLYANFVWFPTALYFLYNSYWQNPYEYQLHYYFSVICLCKSCKAFSRTVFYHAPRPNTCGFQTTVFSCAWFLKFMCPSIVQLSLARLTGKSHIILLDDICYSQKSQWFEHYQIFPAPKQKLVDITYCLLVCGKVSWHVQDIIYFTHFVVSEGHLTFHYTVFRYSDFKKLA